MPSAFVVTGASGFIGRNVVAYLARRGRERVVAVSRRAWACPEGADPVRVAEYSETPFVRDAALIHLAESPDASGEPTPGDETNAISNLQTLLAKGFDGFVYASSARVYEEAGPARRSTDSPVRANGAYASAKLTRERIALDRGASVARLANVFGPAMAEGTVLSDIREQVTCPGGPLVVQDGSAVCDFLWIGDAVAGLVALAENGASGIFNLGTGRGTSVREIAQLALDVAGQGDRPIVSRAANGPSSTLVLDCSRTHALGWRPSTTLERGLEILNGQVP